MPLDTACLLLCRFRKMDLGNAAGFLCPSRHFPGNQRSGGVLPVEGQVHLQAPVCAVVQLGQQMVGFLSKSEDPPNDCHQNR